MNYIETAKLAALNAGAYIQKAKNSVSTLNIEQKSLHDYVSEVDRNSELIIADIIRNEFSDHAVIGEEHGLQGDQNKRYQWVVDPLDGTTNFLRSIPHYAVSIALLIDNSIEVAVVYDPSKNELFSAQRNNGATLNDDRISVSNLTSVESGLYATGIPFSGHNLENISSFTQSMEGLLLKQTSGIRRLGSAALDLAYVACGRYDGYWEANLNAWDIAAGILLVTEAGGVVSDLKGQQTQLESGDILAANSDVHSDMMSVIANHY